MTDLVHVSVPATTANLGPGFDCLGAALTLTNQFQFRRLSSPETPLVIKVMGLEADRVQTDASNLVYQTWVKFYEHIQKPVPPVEIEIRLGVPLARGLGSSATAIVGGLVGANVLAGEPLSHTEVMDLAIAMEGHPDNVVPALVGGCQLAATGLDGHWEICAVQWQPDIVPIVAIPNFELSTADARRVLPPDYSRADAIFNAAHLGLLLRALQTGKREWLKAALQDRIHQPYRQALIPGYEAVYQAALEAGACGLVISGAGPTLLALASPVQAIAISLAMEKAWASQGITANVRVVALDPKGAIATPDPA